MPAAPTLHGSETLWPHTAGQEGLCIMETALLVIFPGLMACAAASDLLTMTIPNKLSLALVVAFAGFALAGTLAWDAILMHVAAGTVVLLLCFAMFAFGWIGGGDAKLAAAIALWFGFGVLLDYLLLAAVAGGALTIAILCLRGTTLPAFALRWDWLTRLHDRRSGVPYGIALAAAALVIYPHTPIWHAVLQ
jgi:prepilin peptidase CpaA